MEMGRLVKIFPSISQSVKQAKVSFFKCRNQNKKIRHTKKQGNKAQRNKMNLHKLTKKKWRSVNHLTSNSDTMVDTCHYTVVQTHSMYNSRS